MPRAKERRSVKQSCELKGICLKRPHVCEIVLKVRGFRYQFRYFKGRQRKKTSQRLIVAFAWDEEDIGHLWGADVSWNG
jgi:hypothetical protein